MSTGTKFDFRNLVGKRQTWVIVPQLRQMDETAQTVDIAFASGAPHERYWGIEKLDMKGMDLSYLRETGAVLFNHNPDCLIGNATNCRIDSDEVARCTVAISKADDCKGYWQKIQEGTLKCVSIGYEITETPILLSQKDGVGTYLCKAKVYEISFVSMPADATVGVGRNLEPNTRIVMAGENVTPATENLPATTPPPAPPVQDQFSRECESVLAFARQINAVESAQEFLLQPGQAVSVQEFRTFEFNRRAKKQTPISNFATDPGQYYADRAAGIQSKISRSKIFRNPETAYRFGQFFLAVSNSKRAQDWCRDNGIPLLENRALNESETTSGGFLVPEEFLPDLIILQTQFGVARQHAMVIPLGSDLMHVPRLDGEMEFSATGEGEDYEESELGFDEIVLTPKLFTAYTEITRQVNEDSMIALGDLISMQLIRAAEKKTDTCYFNGDGSSTYNRINGVIKRLRNPLLASSDPTIADVAGLTVGTGNAYSELTLADFHGVVAKLPDYAYGNAKWFVSPLFKEKVMHKLALAAGGTLPIEIVNGVPVMRFLGYPVVTSNVLPKVEADSQICAVFGDLMMGSYIGERTGLSIAVSEHAAFRKGKIAIRADIRFDVNVYGTGNVTSVDNDKQPGPICGLITKES